MGGHPIRRTSSAPVADAARGADEHAPRAESPGAVAGAADVVFREAPIELRGAVQQSRDAGLAAAADLPIADPCVDPAHARLTTVRAEILMKMTVMLMTVHVAGPI